MNRTPKGREYSEFSLLVIEGRAHRLSRLSVCLPLVFIGVLVVGSDEGVDMATMPASVSMQTLLNASVIVCSDVMNMPMAR